MDGTKEYSFVLSTMPRLHARSRLLELGVCATVNDFVTNTCLLRADLLCVIVVPDSLRSSLKNCKET